MIATGIQEVHRQEGDCVSTLRYFMDELLYSGKFSQDKIFTNSLFPEIRGYFRGSLKLRMPFHFLGDGRKVAFECIV